jgi:hypothetical protein
MNDSPAGTQTSGNAAGMIQSSNEKPRKVTAA